MQAFRLLMVAAVAAMAVAGPAAAVQTPGQTPPVFRGGVEVVQLDVSVVDKSRRPVRGLTAGDFTVLADGEPQPVVAFDAVDIADAPEPPARWMKSVTPDVSTNALDERRLFVLVLDDALVPFDPQMMNNAKKIARSVVDRLGPKDLAAIVFTAGNRAAQDFTGDHAKLLAAVDKFTPGLATYAFGADAQGGVNTDSGFYQFVVNTLRSVAEFLIEIPERRKALIYVGPGVPVDAEASAPMLASGVGKGMADKEIMQRMLDEMREIFRNAQRANLTISSVDPTALALEGFILSNLQRQRLTADVAMATAHRATSLNLDFLQAAAANTGGHAVVNTEDFETGIAQIFEENGSYYLLGFRPTNPKKDGGLRRIEVKVNRPGVDVRARNGYYAPRAETAKSAKAAPSPLAKAMAGLLPDPDLPMQVSLAPFVVPGKRDATVAIVLGVQQDLPAGSAAGRTTENVELLTTAFTPEGGARGSKAQNAKLVIRAGAQGDARYELLSRIDLKPGRYQLRLAAHNNARDRSGSVYADVEVPDFANAPLSLSGAMLNVAPGRVSAPADALTGIVPFAPTAERAFMVTEQVTAFLRVYQNGKGPAQPASLAIRITDDRDRAVVSETRALGAEQFTRTEIAAPAEPAMTVNPRRGMPVPAAAAPAFSSAGLPSADVLFNLPLDRLRPGPYVLTFDLSASRSGATTPAMTRAIRFVVK